MKSNLKFKFTLYIWVTGHLNGEYVIGRTCMFGDQKSLAVVSESGAYQLVLFDLVKDLKKLSIINRQNHPPITSTIPKKKTLTRIEKLILKTLGSINNVHQYR